MSFDTVYIPKLYTNSLLDKVIADFYAHLKSVYGTELIYKIGAVVSEVVTNIAGYDLNKIYISYTSSDSVFFRFEIKDSKYEFKLEVFLDGDDECESTLHIYAAGNKEMATFGSVGYTISVIADKIFNEKDNLSGFFYWKSPEVEYA